MIWEIIWNGNTKHIEEHRLTRWKMSKRYSPIRKRIGQSFSGDPCVFGYTPDGTYIIVVYEMVDDAIHPITAYGVRVPGD